MTKKEILLNHLNYNQTERIIKFNYLVDWSLFLKAMDEYGKQCFEAAREKPSLENMDEYVTKDYIFEEYEDYLKELENERTS